MCSDSKSIDTPLAVSRAGFGKHIASIGLPAVRYYLKILMSEQLVYVVGLFSAKLSILLYYWRIFCITSMRRIIYTVATIVILSCVGAVCQSYVESSNDGLILKKIIANLTQCIPISDFWSLKPAICMNVGATGISYAIITIVTDIILILMPIPYVWRLNMSRWQKIGVNSAFAVASR